MSRAVPTSSAGAMCAMIRSVHCATT